MRRLVISLALAALAAVVYAETVRFDFVSLDDPMYVTRNPWVRQGLTWEGVRWAFSTGEPANWNPLVGLSHMLDSQLYGLAPAGHHATNVGLHAAAAVALFGALSAATSALWPSALVAALFAVHPLGVEAVAWVSARKDVLSGFLGFLSLWAYVTHARRGGAGRYLLATVLLALGLLAKPILVTFPLLFLLFDWWPLGRSRPGRLLLEKVPLLALVALSSLLTLVHERPTVALEHGLAQVPLAARVANAVVSYVRYLAGALWPTYLSVMYPHPDLPGGTPWTAWQVTGAATVLIALSALVLASRRRYALVGWLWYLGALVPVLGLVPKPGFEAMADRFAYVPLVGLLIGVVWGGAELAGRRRAARPLVAIAAVGTVLALAARSRSQAAHWRDSVSLYEHSLAVAPGAPVLHYNLANVLRTRGRSEDAIRHYREAVRLSPDYVEAYNNLGTTLAAAGRRVEAIAVYGDALRVAPGYARTHNNLALALAAAGRAEEAILHYEEAVRLDPGYVLAHHNLAVALEAAGRRDEAVAHYREAFRLAPDFTPAREALARIGAAP